MAGQHRNTRKRSKTLRVASGIVAGATFAGCIGTAYAEGVKLPEGVRVAALTLARPPIEAKQDHVIHQGVRKLPLPPLAAALGPARSMPAQAPTAIQRSTAALAATAGAMHLPSLPAKVAALPAAPKAAPAAPKALPKLIKAADLISLARKQIGVSSGDRYSTWFSKTPRAQQTVARDGGSVRDYVGAEWCDMFVSWLGNQLGISNTVGEDPWTVAHAKWFQNQHRWGTTPKPGAVVFFSWSGGSTADDINHVGIVVKDNHDGTIQTIEGNTDGGQVESKTRDTSEVVGYGYPTYAS